MFRRRCYAASCYGSHRNCVGHLPSVAVRQLHPRVRSARSPAAIPITHTVAHADGVANANADSKPNPDPEPNALADSNAVAANAFRSKRH
jgi:hypothetical protein